MTLKQRAALQTAGILAVTITAAVLINIILEQLTREQLVNGLAVGSIVFLIYSMYGVVLSRLEYDEKVKQLVDKTSN